MSLLPHIAVLRPFLAKQYVTGTSPRSHTNIANASAEILRLTEFTIAAQFKADLDDRGEHRLIFDCKGTSIDRASFLRVHGTGGDVGKLQVFFRTPTATVIFSSTATVDDGEWHNAAFVRESGTNIFRMYLDGAEDGTDTTDPTTTSGAMNDAWGNAHPSSGNPSEPLLGILGQGYIIDSSMSIAQVDSLINSGTLPGGMTILSNLLADGGDSTTVEAELGP